MARPVAPNASRQVRVRKSGSPVSRNRAVSNRCATSRDSLQEQQVTGSAYRASRQVRTSGPSGSFFLRVERTGVNPRVLFPTRSRPNR